MIAAAIDPGDDGTYPSLRVLDEQDRETPYVLDPAYRAGVEPSATLRTLRFSRGLFTEGVVDLGASGRAHGAIEIRSSRPTYFVRVELAASDDRRDWRVLREDALIYRVDGGDGCANAIVSYPRSHARWLRIRVFAPGDAFPIDGVRIVGAQDAQEHPSLTTLAQGPASVDIDDAHAQALSVDTAVPHATVTGVAVTTTTHSFERTFVVQSSSDGLTWETAARTRIFRFGGDEEQLRLIFPERRARHWRVRVENGDDAPLEDLHVTLLAPAHTIVFRAEPGRRYRLVSGDPWAQAPSYDLAAQLEHERWQVGATAQVVDPTAEARPSIHSGPEHRPWLSTAVFALVALVLGCSCLFTLRSLRNGPA